MIKEVKEQVSVVRCYCGEYLGIYNEDYHGEFCINCGNSNYDFMQLIPIMRKRLIEIVESHSLGNIGMDENFINIDGELTNG